MVDKIKKKFFKNSLGLILSLIIWVLIVTPFVLLLLFIIQNKYDLPFVALVMIGFGDFGIFLGLISASLYLWENIKENFK